MYILKWAKSVVTKLFFFANNHCWIEIVAMKNLFHFIVIGIQCKQIIFIICNIQEFPSTNTLSLIR